MDHKVSQDSVLWSLSQKVFHWFHISIASHAHCKYFQLRVEYGPQRPNFGATLGPKISKNSGLRSFSQNFSAGFPLVLVYMSIWANFRDVLNQIEHDSGI